MVIYLCWIWCRLRLNGCWWLILSIGIMLRSCVLWICFGVMVIVKICWLNLLSFLFVWLRIRDCVCKVLNFLVLWRCVLLFCLCCVFWWFILMENWLVYVWFCVLVSLFFMFLLWLLVKDVMLVLFMLWWLSCVCVCVKRVCGILILVVLIWLLWMYVVLCILRLDLVVSWWNILVNGIGLLYCGCVCWWIWFCGLKKVVYERLV